MPESVKTIGTILGYLATAIGLLTLFKTKILEKQRKVIIKESGKEKLEERMTKMDKKLDALTDSLRSFADTNAQFQMHMNQHIKSQNNTNKKLLANIIEQTYYSNQDKKALDMNEFRRITETYEIYHGDEIHGNSYISALYEEMMTWERLSKKKNGTANAAAPFFYGGTKTDENCRCVPIPRDDRLAEGSERIGLRDSARERRPEN